MLSVNRPLLCACADGEQHTSLLRLNHFYLKNSEPKFVFYPATLDSLLLKLLRLRSGGHRVGDVAKGDIITPTLHNLQ